MFNHEGVTEAGRPAKECREPRKIPHGAASPSMNSVKDNSRRPTGRGSANRGIFRGSSNHDATCMAPCFSVPSVVKKNCNFD